MNLSHHFLLSMPHLNDPNFEQSVVYLFEHDESGAWGVVINKPIGMELGDVFEQLDIDGADRQRRLEVVLRGGPVDMQQGIVLHRPGPTFETTQHYDGGVSVSTSIDILRALAAGEEPDEHLVVLGHAGWDAGQLENEILHNSWLTCPADETVLFDTPIHERRDAVAKLIGINIDSVSGQSGHA